MSEQEKRIEELYELTINDPYNTHRIVDLCEVDSTLARRILLETGVNVEGFTITITLDNFGINHILSRHGNSDKETSRGQIPATKSNLIALMSIIQNADTIRLDVKTFRNHVEKETLVFIKEFENRYFVAMEIRRVVKKGKKNRLVLQIFYIIKGTK